MDGFTAVFRFYFLRSIREPAVLVVASVSVFLLLLAPLGAVLGFHEQKALIRDVGISSLFLCGLLIGFVCSGRMEDERTFRCVLLRPVSRFAYLTGYFAGVLLCAVMVNAAVACFGFVILQSRAEGFSSGFALKASVSGVAGSFLWGAFVNFRTKRPFVSSALRAFFVVSLFCFLYVVLGGWEDGGLEADDVLLLQGELLCLFSTGAVLASVWTGGVLFGRAGGIAAGCIVLVLGMLKGRLDLMPAFLRVPGGFLLPNFDVIYSGDLFYADLLTLPWDYVSVCLLYLVFWSLAVVLIGIAGRSWR